jgi:hypothetical protein
MMFPTHWTSDPSFELNRRLAAFCGHAAWWSLVVTVSALSFGSFARTPLSFRPMLLAYGPATGLFILANVGAVLSLRGTRLAAPPIVLACLIGVGIAIAVARNIPLWSLWTVQVVLLVPARLFERGARSLGAGGVVPDLVAAAEHIARWSYLCWAFPGVALARVMRLRTDRRSFICPDSGCGLTFDDPPLRCACGGGALRTFPVLARPWLACCDAPACDRIYPSWANHATLTKRFGLRIDFGPCRLSCRDPHPPGAGPPRVLIVPTDSNGTRQLLEMIASESRAAPTSAGDQPVDIYATTYDGTQLEVGLLAPVVAPYWAGGWHAIILTAREDSSFLADLEFGLSRIVLPRDPDGWGGPSPRPRRGALAQLTRALRPDPVEAPFGRRIMPLIGVTGRTEPVTRFGLDIQGIARDRDSLGRFLRAIPPP